MEMLFAIPIAVLAVAGLSLGLLLRGRGPVTACEGMRCLGAECATCPHRRTARMRENADG